MNFEALDQKYFPGFERNMIDVGNGQILTLIGGSGPPVLMLHGDPQTHLCWHQIAPELSKHFTVILTDLPGRGESRKPKVSGDHESYWKKSMAHEQLRIMNILGFQQFNLVGHDRGGRVAFRMALDYPDSIIRLSILDIVPTVDFYSMANAAIAQDYFYFYFLTQPASYPENLILGNPKMFMKNMLLGLSLDNVFLPELLDHYVQSSSTKESVIAMCECFRAGFNYDVKHDQEDLDTGHEIIAPTLIFWGENGVVGKHFDMQKTWNKWCNQVEFDPMPCGHFIPEEVPLLVSNKLIQFLR